MGFNPVTSYFFDFCLPEPFWIYHCHEPPKNYFIYFLSYNFQVRSSYPIYSLITLSDHFTPYRQPPVQLRSLQARVRGAWGVWTALAQVPRDQHPAGPATNPTPGGLGRSRRPLLTPQREDQIVDIAIDRLDIPLFYRNLETAWVRVLMWKNPPIKLLANVLYRWLEMVLIHLGVQCKIIFCLKYIFGPFMIYRWRKKIHSKTILGYWGHPNEWVHIL